MTRAYIECETCKKRVEVTLVEGSSLPTTTELEQQGWKYLGMSADQSTVRWGCPDHAPPGSTQ